MMEFIKNNYFKNKEPLYKAEVNICVKSVKQLIGIKYNLI